MINLFSDLQLERRLIHTLRNQLYRYDQPIHAPNEIPIYYIDNEGFHCSSNYTRSASGKVTRRFGHSLEEYTIRQWIFTCMLTKYYRPNDAPYHAMNTRYPYPPMTHYKVFGTRD